MSWSAVKAPESLDATLWQTSSLDYDSQLRGRMPDSSVRKTRGTPVMEGPIWISAKPERALHENFNTVYKRRSCFRLDVPESSPRPGSGASAGPNG